MKKKKRREKKEIKIICDVNSNAFIIQFNRPLPIENVLTWQKSLIFNIVIISFINGLLNSDDWASPINRVKKVPCCR